MTNKRKDYTRQKDWPTFNKAKEIIQLYQIQTAKDYHVWSKRNKYNLPANPNLAYKDNWQGWTYFLGKEKPSLTQLKKLCIENNITRIGELKTWRDREFYNIPVNIAQSYKQEGYVNFDDFIGDRYLSFEKAKEYMNIQNKQIKTATHFYAWSKAGERPKNIPSRPDRTYKKEWISWEHFFKA